MPTGTMLEYFATSVAAMIGDSQPLAGMEHLFPSYERLLDAS